MNQASLGRGHSTKRTRKREFLAEMQRVVPWTALVELVTPFAPEGRRGRPPFSVETMLRIHFMQQWFTLSDPAMEEALHDMPLFREFAGLGGWGDRLPDETTILRFRHTCRSSTSWRPRCWRRSTSCCAARACCCAQARWSMPR